MSKTVVRKFGSSKGRLLVLAASVHAGAGFAFAQQYSFTNISTLAPSTKTDSRAFAINAAGTIVGDYTNAGTTTFFTYNAGGNALTPFPTVNGTQLDYYDTVPAGGRIINDSGAYIADAGTVTVSGLAQQDGTPAGGIYNPSGSPQYTSIPAATTYQTSNQVATGVLGAAINNSNYVVGTQFFETEPTSNYPSSNYHGIVYNPVTKSTIDIGGAVPGGGADATTGTSHLYGISNNNVIVGEASVGAGGHGTNQDAIMGVSNGSGGYTVTDLASVIKAGLSSDLTYQESTATNISANGKYIVGTFSASSASLGKEVYRSFEITNGTVSVDLGTLGGTTTFQALASAVNDQGVVVGHGAVASGALHGFVYMNGGMVDVNSLVSVPNTVFQSVVSINDSGLLVGYDAVMNVSNFSAFLLTPVAVPEPASAALIAFSTAAWLRRPRRYRPLENSFAGKELL